MDQDNKNKDLAEVKEDAKEMLDAVKAESAEVVQEVTAAVKGEKLDTANVGAAGYRAQSDGSESPKAIASLVLGVISLLFALFGSGTNWIGLIAGIVGIVLGAMARKENQTSLATAGFVCSIVGSVLSIVFFVACVICVGAMGAALAAI